VTQKLGERLGRPFVVEDKAGGATILGTQAVARAAPDGYTLELANTTSHATTAALGVKLAYDPVKDFTPVGMLAYSPFVLLVTPGLDAHSVKDLVALIKRNPNKYSFASPGFGTPSHLLGEQFRVVLGLDLVHVPYGGSGPAMMSAVAGDTPIAFAALSAAVPQIQDGKLRALAVMSKNRSQALPDLPTIGEAGYPELDGDAWIGALVPTGTPKEIIALLQHEIVNILALPDVKERLAVLGLDPVGGTPEEFTAQMKLEMEKWAKVIQAARIKAE